MSVWTVILIIAVIAAIILGVLYFVGRKMQAKQEDQRAQLDQMAQTVNMLVIDKKRMKIMEAGFPKMVTDNIPKRAKMSKVPVVKAKVGPKITPLLCDEAIFDDVPVKAEIKAVVSGIYITSIKNLRNVAPPTRLAFTSRTGMMLSIASWNASSASLPVFSATILNAS